MKQLLVLKEGLKTLEASIPFFFFFKSKNALYKPLTNKKTVFAEHERNTKALKMITAYTTKLELFRQEKETFSLAGGT